MNSSSWTDLEKEALSMSGSSYPKERCKFGRYLDSLGDNAEYVIAALNNPDISNSSLHTALRSRGISCGLTVLNYHKAKTCTCYKGQ